MDIVEKLNTLCIDKHVTIATSESCTAGSIASKICSVSGSSFFLLVELSLIKIVSKKIC